MAMYVYSESLLSNTKLVFHCIPLFQPHESETTKKLISA